MASSTIYQLVWQTRRIFQHLRVISDELLESTGINTSQRAVLETLYPDQAISVPRIAQQLTVSRQHIQVIVNELQLLKLVKTVENPAHKRSLHIQRTEKGRSSFEQIKQREAGLLNEIASEFSGDEMGAAAETLRNLRDHLNREVISKLERDE